MVVAAAPAAANLKAEAANLKAEAADLKAAAADQVTVAAILRVVPTNSMLKQDARAVKLHMAVAGKAQAKKTTKIGPIAVKTSNRKKNPGGHIRKTTRFRIAERECQISDTLFFYTIPSPATLEANLRFQEISLKSPKSTYINIKQGKILTNILQKIRR